MCFPLLCIHHPCDCTTSYSEQFIMRLNREKRAAPAYPRGPFDFGSCTVSLRHNHGGTKWWRHHSFISASVDTATAWNSGTCAQLWICITFYRCIVMDMVVSHGFTTSLDGCDFPRGLVVPMPVPRSSFRIAFPESLGRRAQAQQPVGLQGVQVTILNGISDD